jgi:hypothetical protein
MIILIFFLAPETFREAALSKMHPSILATWQIRLPGRIHP